MNRNLLHIFCAVLAIFGIVACASQCFNNQSSIGLAGFYSAASQKQISVSDIQVYGVGAPNDSLILSSATAISQVYLPMPVIGNECAFVFHYTQEAISSTLLNDTLTLRYDAVPYFAGTDCGAMYVFKINEFTYTTHIVDSIAIPTMEINNIDRETIQIYLRTSSQ
ncbi:MAG: hypothetical protein K2J74_07420 [Muribaculaceae bacterium]|nr:hypothetical protein [Muribaculaceae bacterium]